MWIHECLLMYNISYRNNKFTKRVPKHSAILCMFTYVVLNLHGEHCVHVQHILDTQSCIKLARNVMDTLEPLHILRNQNVSVFTCDGTQVAF